MKIISSNDLKNVIETKEYGKSAKIFTADYNNHKYCYRLFKDSVYEKWIIDNMGELTEEEFSEEYLTPKYIVDKNKGTLSEFAENAYDLGYISARNKQIRYLQIGKILLENLHKVHKYIHGDISAANILVNDDEVKTYFCDFDTAIKIGREPKNFWNFSVDLYPYFKYYKFDEKVDIYKFNLMTLAVLLDKYESEVFSLIENNKLDDLEENKNVKKIAKELLLQDTRKPYSGEFIIDYI